MKENTYSSKILRALYPVKDILLFLLISFLIIEGWRLLDLDLIFSPLFSDLFRWLMSFEFSISVLLLKPLLPFSYDTSTFLITLPDSRSIYLYEGCSGLKQVLQFSLIMLLYPGPVVRKTWFIPFSALLLILAAIVHFVFLCYILYASPANYDFMHDHISRWFFFGVFFLLWMWFNRKEKPSGMEPSESDVKSK
jgi:exosortase/archaeosortase family protein